MISTADGCISTEMSSVLSCVSEAESKPKTGLMTLIQSSNNSTCRHPLSRCLFTEAPPTSRRRQTDKSSALVPIAHWLTSSVRRCDREVFFSRRPTAGAEVRKLRGLSRLVLDRTTVIYTERRLVCAQATGRQTSRKKPAHMPRMQLEVITCWITASSAVSREMWATPSNTTDKTRSDIALYRPQMTPYRTALQESTLRIAWKCRTKYDGPSSRGGKRPTWKMSDQLAACSSGWIDWLSKLWKLRTKFEYYNIEILILRYC